MRKKHLLERNFSIDSLKKKLDLLKGPKDDIDCEG